MEFIEMKKILEYDPETKKWIQIGTMREARREPAVTDEDYADFCHWISFELHIKVSHESDL